MKLVLTFWFCFFFDTCDLNVLTISWLQVFLLSLQHTQRNTTPIFNRVITEPLRNAQNQLSFSSTSIPHLFIFSSYSFIRVIMFESRFNASVQLYYDICCRKHSKQTFFESYKMLCGHKICPKSFFLYNHSVLGPYLKFSKVGFSLATSSLKVCQCHRSSLLI